MRLHISIVAMVLGLAGVALAEPLKTQDIPAGAKWVAHVDFDAARESKVVKHVEEQVLARPGAHMGLDLLKQETGMDLFQDLHSATLLGTGFQPEDGILVLRAKCDTEKVMTKVREKEQYRTEKYGKHDLSLWIDKGKNMVGTFYSPTVVVVGQKQDAVTAVLDVLDGKAACLPPKSPLAAAATPGQILHAAAIGLGDLPNAPARSPLLRQAEAVSVSLGEREGSVFATASLVGKTPQAAEQFKQAIDGIKAMAQMNEQLDEDAQKMLAGARIDLADRTVKMELKMPVADLLGIMEKMRDATNAPQ